MSRPISLTLPTLPRYSGVPRRYEETRPVLIQDFSHRRILGLGHEIHHQLHQQAEEEKQKSIRATEETVWLEAKTLHDQELKRVKEEAQLEMERMVQKFQKEQDHAIKEEALRVEMAMQKAALEQVRVEREEAAQRLKEAVAEVEAQTAQKIEAEVKVVREEEQRLAAREMTKITRMHNDKLREVTEQAEELLQRTIEENCAEKETAVREAVEMTREEEKLRFTQDLAATIVSYDIDIAKQRIELDIQLNEINRLLAKIEDRDRAKQRIKEELKTTRQSFQDYITRVGKFTEGHAGFMITPVSESVLKLSEQQL